MWLMHVGKENLFEQVSGVGLFVFPPGEPTEIKDDYLAQSIVDHKILEGLIEVPIIRDKRGMSFDLETAIPLATKALQEGRIARVQRYIKTQREDRIAAGKPALPPSPSILKIIEEEGIDLASEGITLSGVGFKVANQQSELLAKMVKMESTMNSLAEQNSLLAEQNKLLREQLESVKTKQARG
jgi:hypothetical protein